MYVKKKINQLEKRFNKLKNKAKDAILNKKISVKQIVDSFTSMPVDDMEEHKQFLHDHLNELYSSADQSELFGKLSLLHWDYLSYQLLDFIISEFGLDVAKEMEAYKLDLQRFREKTPLEVFCKSQKRRRRKPTEEFQEVVAEFDWPHQVTLEDVEQFRQEYAYHYCLRECAMMLAKIHLGSVFITWYLPHCLTKKLREKEAVPKKILKKYCVISLKVSGIQVYPPEVICTYNMQSHLLLV